MVCRSAHGLLVDLSHIILLTCIFDVMSVRSTGLLLGYVGGSLIHRISFVVVVVVVVLVVK